MQSRSTTAFSELADRAEADYWELTRRPLSSLMFLLPLLMAYECGIWWVSDRQVLVSRHGADRWMSDSLSLLGISGVHILPWLVVLGLVVWHYCSNVRTRTQDQTCLSPDLMAGMYGESLLFAVLLIVLGQTQDLLFQRVGEALSLFLSLETLHAGLGYLGAGIYEEILFRGILCSGLFGLGMLLNLSRGVNLLLAVVVSSAIFSAAHYIGPSADIYTHFSFVFRFVAGLYFAGLFLVRGLGIAIGTHAIYDLIVGLLLPQGG